VVLARAGPAALAGLGPKQEAEGEEGPRARRASGPCAGEADASERWAAG
jgi:hypothetical protein